MEKLDLDVFNYMIIYVIKKVEDTGDKGFNKPRKR